MTAGTNQVLQFGGKNRGDHHLLGLTGCREVELVQGKQSSQFHDRFRVVVHPQIDRDVVEAPVTSAVADHQQSRRLPAPTVSPRRVPGGKCSQQQPCQRGRCFPPQPGTLHGLDNLLSSQDIALDRVAFADAATRPIQAGRAGVRCGASRRVDDPYLSAVAPRVGLEEMAQGLHSGRVGGQPREGERLVGDVGVGLGGNRADAGNSRRNRCANGQELRGDGDAPRLAVGRPGNDGEGHGGSVECGLFWNAADPPPALTIAFAALYRAIDTALPFTRWTAPNATGYEAILDKAADGIRRSGSFEEPRRLRFDWAAVTTRDAWLDQAPTAGGHNRIAPDKLDLILKGMAKAFDEYGGTFTLSYTTLLLVATRIGG